MNEGYGSALLKKPELVEDMVKTAKSRINNIPISIKIRVLKDISETIELARRVEKIGCSFLTVHGRRPDQKSTSAANLDAIKLVKESVKIPVLANGTIWTEKDVLETHQKTGVDGVMSAVIKIENKKQKIENRKQTENKK